MRKTISESEGSAKVKDINKSRSRKLMRMILSSNVLATFSGRPCKKTTLSNGTSLTAHDKRI